MIVVSAVAAALALSIAACAFAAVRVRRAERRFAAERASFETLALEDPLTGLPNKRAFINRLDTELRRAAREYYPVAVVVLDLDRFKQINDSWGHAVGDEALVALARHLQAELRAGDFCGRMGGDEFMLALVRAEAQSADRVLERVRIALESVAVGPAKERLRFSAGISEFPRHGSTRDALIGAADAALYSGKAAGRNRSTVYTPDASDALSPGRTQEAARQRSLLTTLQALAKAVDGKSRYTAGHSERVASYAAMIAADMGLREDRVDAVRQAALLHDVGKIVVPDSILTKDRPLNLEELAELERHSELGRAMLAGAGMPELARWVRHVHERFDGDGYPDGLAGEEIPLESRILHAADALDAMTRPTVFRRHRPLEQALAEFSFCTGTRIDPAVARHTVELIDSGRLAPYGYQPKRRPRRHLGEEHRLSARF